MSCRSRVSAEQLDSLLSFMEEHPEFAASKHSVYSRFSNSKLWRLLAERLNAVGVESGGARKSPDKWCRFWADIKYKTRKKCATGCLGELSAAEERLRILLNNQTSCGVSTSDTRRPSEDESRRDDDMASEASGGSGRLSTEELLAEAAMRSALAAEKQAEAVTQAVDLLRDLVAILREHHAPPPPQHHDHALTTLQHHHHRL